MVTPKPPYPVSTVRVSGVGTASWRRTRNIEMVAPSVDGYSTRSTAKASGSRPAAGSLHASAPPARVHRKSWAGRVKEVNAKKASSRSCAPESPASEPASGSATGSRSEPSWSYR